MAHTSGAGWTDKKVDLSAPKGYKKVHSETSHTHPGAVSRTWKPVLSSVSQQATPDKQVGTGVLVPSHWPDRGHLLGTCLWVWKRRVEQDHLHQDLMLTSAMLLLQCHVFLYSWALPLYFYCNSTYSTGMDRKSLILWLHRCRWEPFENLLAYWPLSCPPVLKQFSVRTYSSCFIFYSFRVLVWTWRHNLINSHTLLF